MILTHIAKREEPLKNCLTRELQISSTLLKRLKYASAIRVDGKTVQINHLLLPGQRIDLDLDAAEQPCDVLPEAGELVILYEDAALLAVCKPRGMLTHPSHGRSTGTLLGRVLAHTPQAHAVSRLDRDTTGVVLFAKNAYVQDRVVIEQKVYTALAWGRFEQAWGTVDASIGRMDSLQEGSLLPTMKRTVGEGKPAVTHYAVERVRMLHATPCSRLRLYPQTGRTHQLRVHCASLGHPLLGDRLYGTAESAALSEQLALPGHLLHAGMLRFCHPITGETVSVQCEDDFETLLADR